MAQLNGKCARISNLINLKKSMETYTTIYSLEYRPQIICNCGKTCKYKNKEGIFTINEPAALTNVSNSPIILKNHQTKQLIKDDKNESKKDIFNKYRDPNDVNLNESAIASNNNNSNKSGSETVNISDQSTGVCSESNCSQDTFSNLV